MTTPSDLYDEALLRFVERFAIVLNETGMPRMAARVFAFVLADDAETYTAAELAAGLRVSSAAISSAVRYLVQTGLLGRERRPGERVDHYRVYDEDVWSAILRQREPLLRRNEEFLAEGAEMLDSKRPGGQRIRETLEFYRFARAESPRMVERWQEHRRRHRLGSEHGEHSEHEEPLEHREDSA
ncbi:GbsR/MarR family transcriptional regulator [Actinomadura sp. 6N118]|uniref:GbsR/MarR family transcriptional regulator n=1 Tax=Actinomadura sp. 6N118 TaxID=3375151 RepID=UPI00379B4DD8